MQLDGLNKSVMQLELSLKIKEQISPYEVTIGNSLKVNMKTTRRCSHIKL